MKKLFKIGSLVGILSMLLNSCDSGFEDINSNPNRPGQATSAYLATNIILSITNYGGDAKSFIANSASPKYVGYANEGQMGAQYNNPSSGSFGSAILIPNIEKMNEISAQSDAVNIQNSYKAVGKFAKSWIMFRMTMAMGDIPYSEAGQGAIGLTKPKYDTQESVLINILNDLKEAEQLFAAGGTFSGDPTPYNGDAAKWRRATNAFALKVLMSLSKKEGVASVDVKNRFAQIVASNQLMTSATGHFGLNYSTTNQYKLFSAGNKLFTDRAIASSVIIDPLKSLNDRRLFYYFEPSRAQKTAGKLESDPAAYIGADISESYTTLSADWVKGKYSIINNRYNRDAVTEPRMLLTFSEQQLILAEAHIRGWINTSTAKAYYEEGVKEALLQVSKVLSYADNVAKPAVASQVPHHTMPINAAYISTYFTGEAAFKATAADQLKQIWLQRYILNFFQDGDFSYWEYRRNGYPVFPINPATNMNSNNTSVIPVRNGYPGSESNLNPANLKEAIDRQFGGFDDVNKPIWLLQ